MPFKNKNTHFLDPGLSLKNVPFIGSKQVYFSVCTSKTQFSELLDALTVNSIKRVITGSFCYNRNCDHVSHLPSLD